MTATRNVCAAALVRPAQIQKLAPCVQGCAAGSDVRQWVGIVAQRGMLGLSNAQAYTRAWRLITETNPFPASLGRICPHPCESGCNRAGKDDAVAINAMERFIGDWALKQGLRLSPLDGAWGHGSAGVIGSGPAGLSFAYQLARRGHRVTVYEKRAAPGGILRHGIPAFRLPKSILEAEVDRLVDLGVELRLNVEVGRSVTMDQLRQAHDVLFISVGAGKAVQLGVPGEDGPGVISGIDFLDVASRGEAICGADDIVVVGGGRTALDVARTARRQGAAVTLLYRRTRDDMPAADEDVAAALAEGVAMKFLAAPVAILRDGIRPRAVSVQRMASGAPDASGRRQGVPVAGATYEISAGFVIVAVSQTPDWTSCAQLAADADSADADRLAGEDPGRLCEGVWVGGDALTPGIAAMAIAQGRRAAEAAHAFMAGTKSDDSRLRSEPPFREVAAHFCADIPRTHVVEQPVGKRLAQPYLEVYGTVSEEAFLREAERCFSCGQCNGCQYCFMYCTNGSFTRIDRVQPGTYFALSLDRCMGCGKCIELCPTGFLSQHAPAP